MKGIFDEAIRLRGLGLAVHWLHPRSKKPILEGWTTAPVLSVDELRMSYRDGYNVGFRPGVHSLISGKAVLVLDIDVRGGPEYAPEAYAAAATLAPGYPFTALSGSGVGRHIYVLCPIGLVPPSAATTIRKCDVQIGPGKPAWMIEVLSTGKNVVLPPSIHPDTGKPYQWVE